MRQMNLLISLSLPKSFLYDNLVALLIFRNFFSPQYLCGKNFAQRTAWFSVKELALSNQTCVH